MGSSQGMGFGYQDLAVLPSRIDRKYTQRRSVSLRAIFIIDRMLTLLMLAGISNFSTLIIQGLGEFITSSFVSH